MLNNVLVWQRNVCIKECEEDTRIQELVAVALRDSRVTPPPKQTKNHDNLNQLLLLDLLRVVAEGRRREEGAGVRQKTSHQIFN